MMQLNLIYFLDWVTPAQSFLYACYWDPTPERRVPLAHKVNNMIRTDAPPPYIAKSSAIVVLVMQDKQGSCLTQWLISATCAILVLWNDRKWIYTCFMDWFKHDEGGGL